MRHRPAPLLIAGALIALAVPASASAGEGAPGPAPPAMASVSSGERVANNRAGSGVSAISDNDRYGAAPTNPGRMRPGKLAAVTSTAAAGECHPGTYQDLTIPAGNGVRVFFSGTFNSYSGTIAWGDGATSTTSGSGSWTHFYSSPGDFTVRVRGSGSSGNPATSCTDRVTFKVGVRVLARLGIVLEAQTEGDVTGQTLVHVPIYLHPGSSPTPVSVSWRTVDGTAKAGSDYVAGSGVMQFSPGTVSKEVVISIVGDTVPEATEGFSIQLTGANGAFVDGGYDFSGITIQDDDGALRCPGNTSLRGNHVVGTAAAETLRGSPTRDIICGLAGNDRLVGLDGNDVLLGGTGTDTLLGGDGNDSLSGDAGSDDLDGGTGTDTCDGGPGRNTLRNCEQ